MVNAADDPTSRGSRVYERAHGASIHGAVLGLLLGTGVLTDTGQIAHLHINILGWAGLTLFATLVFFGRHAAHPHRGWC